MLRIIKALPDGFCYQYAGTEKSATGLGKPGDSLVRLNFRPNPSYGPPSVVEQVLQGMDGYVLIDPSARRLARIDGRLSKPVNFGWGIFGHWDQGGSFRVQQADVGDDSWAITEMHLQITGKILLLKSLSLMSDEVFTGFQRLPSDLPLARAVELLQSERERLAQNIYGPQPLPASVLMH